MCSMIQPIIERIAAGERAGIPLAEATEVAGGIVRINAKIRQTVAVLIADFREEFPDPADWIVWIDETFQPTNRSDRSHLIDVGGLLTGLRNAGTCIMIQCYREIFAIDFFKLLSLCRIAKHRSLEEIPAFLSHNPGYATMKREAFRAAVAAWLNEEPAAADQPDLPGFEEALDVFTRINSATLRTVVSDPEKAAHSLRAGIGLLGAAIAFELDQDAPDAGTLQMTRAALLAEAAKIEQKLAQFGE